jgi:hypothetical protein
VSWRIVNVRLWCITLFGVAQAVIARVAPPP